MKKWLLLALLFAQRAAAQEMQRLTLSQAYDLARQNYPLIKQKELVKQTAGISVENLGKGYLPQLTISGQATYQSDVTQVKVPIPGINIEAPSKDQYKLVGEASQLLYDGGAIRQQKNMQQLNAAVEDQKIEVELHNVKDRINQLYLGILYLDAQLLQAALVKEDLQTGIRKTAAQVQNGLVLKSNLTVLQAELLKTEQRSIELKASRKGMVETLGLFLNRPLNENIVLEPTVVTNFSAGANIQRPELQLYASQSKLILQQNRLIAARNLPRASAFIQGGYGRPGLNMLKNSFDFFYIGGLRLNWSLGGLYTARKEKQLTEINKKQVDIQQETFLLNINTQLKQQQADIDKFQQLIGSDNQIIDLRSQVKEAAKAQLDNAVITANDYLREVNAEDQARQALILHQLQLLQAQINYQTTSGKQ